MPGDGDVLPNVVPEEEWVNAVDDLMNDAARQFIEGGYYTLDGGQAVAPDPPPEERPPEPVPTGMDPKCALNQFCQRFCRRPVTRHDIIYSSQQWPSGWQGTVQLNCLQGRKFAGEVCPTRKESEKSAALQALRFHAADIASLSQAFKRPGKGLGAFSQFSQFGNFGQLGQLGQFGAGQTQGSPSQFPVPQSLPALTNTVSAGLPMPALEDGSLNSLAQEFGSPSFMSLMHNPKTNLNAICMKIARRVPQKEDMLYETGQVVGGYQSVVKLPCLPGPWGQQAWAGQICSQRKDSEQSAAGAALEMILADPLLSELVNARKVQAGARKGRGQRLMPEAMSPTSFFPVCFSGRALGVVQVSIICSLSEVREKILSDRMQGVPQDYLFFAAGCPVPRSEESRKLAVECAPVLNIVEVPGAADATLSGLPAPVAAETATTSDVPSGGLRRPRESDDAEASQSDERKRRREDILVLS